MLLAKQKVNRKMKVCKNNSSPPQLCEIVTELLREGKPYYEQQEKLAAELARLHHRGGMIEMVKLSIAIWIATAALIHEGKE